MLTPQIYLLNKGRSHFHKVSFNIASEASYVYILSGRKLIKNAKKNLASF